MDAGVQVALYGLSQFYNQVEFRSAITPSAAFTVQDLTSDGPPNPIVEWLRPTLVFSVPQGRTVIAPYGEAPDNGLSGAIGTLALIFGAGFLAGTFFSKKRF